MRMNNTTVCVLYGVLDTTTEKPFPELLQGAEHHAESLVELLRNAGYPAIRVYIDSAHVLEQKVRDVQEFYGSYVVFLNSILGLSGFNGDVVSTLEKCHASFVGSSSWSQRVCTDKMLTKQLLKGKVKMPQDTKFFSQATTKGWDSTPQKIIVKMQGSARSSGIEVTDFDKDNPPVIGVQSMAEPLVPGRDVTVLMLNREEIFIAEVTSNNFDNVYDDKAKYGGESRFNNVLRLEERVIKPDCQIIYDELRLRGPIRIDGRLTDSLVFLEVNTQLRLTSDGTAGKAWVVNNPKEPYVNLIRRIMELNVN